MQPDPAGIRRVRTLTRYAGLSAQSTDELAEAVAALLEIAELVPTRTSRRQKHGLARHGVSGGSRNGSIQHTAVAQLDSSLQRRVQPTGGRANQVRADATRRDRVAQQPEVLPLRVVTAEDHADAALAGLERDQGRADVR